MSPEEVSGQGHTTRRYNLQPTSQEKLDEDGKESLL